MQKLEVNGTKKQQKKIMAMEHQQIKQAKGGPALRSGDIEIEDDQCGSTDIDLEKEARELNYYMTRQARYMSRGSKSK